MKICFTLSSLSAGGAERVATSLANNFVKMGHQVTLLLVSIDHNNSFYEIDNSVDVLPLLKDKKDKKPLRRIKILKRTLLELQPDIVIAFLPHICVYTYYALRNTKIPFICSERNDPNQYSLIYKVLLKKAFKKANGCVFQTSDARKFYKMVRDEKSNIIFNPVSLTVTTELKKKTKKDKVFLSVGRLTPQKNFPLLISSFKKFEELHPGYKLIIYGEGPLRKELESLIQELQLDGSVFLPGTNNKWHDEALNASAFISSSNYEGMPNCLEEALCLGCPSIATNCPVGGSKELMNLLGSGKLVEMNNAEQMTCAMNEIVEEEPQIENVNYESLKIENISKQWIRFIENILKVQ